MTSHCVSLWIGDSLGPVERACLRSVMKQGHSVALYCYGSLGGIPKGVELRDASAIIPQERILRHRSGSVALFSDWFRYELQKRALGTWIDTDNYLIAPLDMTSPNLFGRQVLCRPGILPRQRESIAVGVLRLPADSPMLAPLLSLFENGNIPDWLPAHLYVLAKLKKRLGAVTDIASYPWGTAGPFALTALARRFGLSGEAQPSDVFNPVPWYKADWIRDPRAELDSMITERTVGVHLWNDVIKGFKDQPAPSGSFLDRLHREGRE